MNILFKNLIVLLILVNNIYCEEQQDYLNSNNSYNINNNNNNYNNNNYINNNYYFKVSWSGGIKCYSKTKQCHPYSIQKINFNNNNYNSNNINNKIENEEYSNTKSILNEISIHQLIVNEKSPLSKIQHFFINKESNDIIVYGNIVKKKINNRRVIENNLNVVRVYKQLPLGNKIQITDKYYTFNHSNFPCLDKPSPSPTFFKVEKPCYPLTSTLVNYNNYTYLISKIIYPYLDNVGKYFDNHWLNYKSTTQDQSKLIALGTINNNNEMVVSNAFINIPDPYEKCTPPESIECKSPSVVTNSRNVNRCLINSTCTLVNLTNNNSTINFPNCPNGYYLTFFTGHNGGILEFNCDANFLTDTY
ncbi:hypothetical protein ACTFIU_001719 [Dictyostelium citrinum]